MSQVRLQLGWENTYRTLAVHHSKSCRQIDFVDIVAHVRHRCIGVLHAVLDPLSDLAEMHT